MFHCVQKCNLIFSPVETYLNPQRSSHCPPSWIFIRNILFILPLAAEWMEWRSVHSGIGIQNRKTRVFYILAILVPELWIKKRVEANKSMSNGPHRSCMALKTSWDKDHSVEPRRALDSWDMGGTKPDVTLYTPFPYNGGHVIAWDWLNTTHGIDVWHSSSVIRLNKNMFPIYKSTKGL